MYHYPYILKQICFYLLFRQVKNEGRALFLNAVCMKCLDGKDADRKLCCRFCATQWDGSSLIMGTMYAYDVFAAMPCCNERLKVCISISISISTCDSLNRLFIALPFLNYSLASCFCREIRLKIHSVHTYNIS